MHHGTRFILEYMRPFVLTINPVSARCTCACDYCHYEHVLDLYPSGRFQRQMSLATAEHLIARFLEQGMQQVSVRFSGGEPLLAGQEFFENTGAMIRAYKREGQIVSISVETNGVLLDILWASFLRAADAHVGVSLDGPRELHDHHRKTPAGKGTFDQVMDGIAALKQVGTDFHINAALTPFSAEKIEESWRFFREQGFVAVNYRPCVGDSPDASAALTSAHYGAALRTLFDLWLDDGYSHVSVGMFDDILAWMLDGTPRSCAFQDECDNGLLVEYNGDVYPCEFAVVPEWRIGNVNAMDFEAIMHSAVRRRFAEIKRLAAPECGKCRYRGFCRKDCSRYRFFAAEPMGAVSCMCPGFKEFLDYAWDRFAGLRDEILARRKTMVRQYEVVTAPRPSSTKIPAVK
jgi:uncharacterized protein